MAKKGLILLIVAILLTFTSCGLDYRYSLDENLHYQIECFWGEDNPSHIIYQDDTYMFVGTTHSFKVDVYKDDDNYYKSYEDDVMLSWNGYRYIGYLDTYYSYSSDRPVFIYNTRTHKVYFREDYNYFTDTFVIGDTGKEIVFEDIFGSKKNSFDFVNPVRVALYSEQCPRINIYVYLVYTNDQWYISLPDSDDVWIPSDEFIQILFENGII